MAKAQTTTPAAKAGGKTKKKIRKNVPKGVCHIQATFNNTIVTIADLYGNTWTPENPGAKYPRMTTGAVDNNNQLSTFWMADGRYLRLKNLELGYTLPKRIANKIAMQNLRVYLSGVNLPVDGGRAVTF